MEFPKWLQSRLTAHGFPVGPIDGDIGPLTTAAIKAFQKAKGIPVTGTATDATVTALRSTSSSIPAPFDRELATSNAWPTQANVPSFFGAVGTQQVLVDLPFPMKIAWDLKVSVRRMSLHKKVADSAVRAFRKIEQEYSPSQRSEIGIDIFGGALNVRKMRGGNSYSMHSWGIAIDFDPERNQLKWGRERARLARSDAEIFWRIWEEEGWVSLGRARNYDWMHVQAARL